MSNLHIMENEYLQVSISPEAGASIYAMKYKLKGKWVDVMRPTLPEAAENRDAGSFSSFNMIPYSNRIENGLLKFQGKEYPLQVNTPEGHTIHGDVRMYSWEVVEANKDKISLSFDSQKYSEIVWPFPFMAKMDYWLEGRAFYTRMELTNTGSGIMPGGMGIHPYFMRKLSEEDHEVRVEIPTRGIYPGATPIPTGSWTEIPEAVNFCVEKTLRTDFLDKCYRVGDHTSIFKWPGSGVKLTMETDALFCHMIIYCPRDDHGFFAVEPVTNCNNGFNMAEEGIEDTGTLYIEPGQKVEGVIKITMDEY